MMKNLPNNLKNLILHLGYNNLGVNSENIKELQKVMKWIPNNLHSLILKLYYNSLGKNDENIKYFGDSI